MPVHTLTLYAIQARLGNPVEWSARNLSCFDGHVPVKTTGRGETGA